MQLNSNVEVIVADPDPIYTERFAAFTRSSSNAQGWRLVTFTQLGPLILHLQTNQAAGFKRLAFVQQHLYEQLHHESPNDLTICLLTETAEEKGTQQLPVCFKYQSLQKICQFGSSLLEKKENDSNLNDGHNKSETLSVAKKNAKVISVYSACGGAGKTSFATQLVRYYASQQQRVLYVSLEWLPSADVWLPLQTSPGFSRMLYELSYKTSDYRMDEWVVYSDRLRCDYLAFYQSLQDRTDCSAAIVEKLLSALKQQGKYEILIIDLDTALSGCIQAALKLADQRYLLVLDELLSFQKTKQLLSVLELDREGWTVVLNKFTGRQLLDYNGMGLPIATRIPYIPEWKNADQLHRILDHDQFYRSLRGWLNEESVRL